MHPSALISTWRMWVALPLIAVAALLASGCVKADIELTMAPDGTVNGTVLLAYDREFMQGFEMTAESARETLRMELEDEAGADFKCEPWEDATYLGVECKVSGATMEELSAEVVMDYQLTFTRVDDTVSMSGEVDLRELGTEFDGVENFDTRLQVTFPGLMQRQTDGEGLEKTVAWQFQLGRRTEIQAVAAIQASVDSSTEIPWLLIGASAIVLLVVAGAVGFFILRRGRAAPPPAPPEPPAAGPVAY
jgi:hypothetical protein